MPAADQTTRPRFAIVCDSACDLPLDTFEGSGIVMVPMHVVLGDRDMRDCIDVDPNEFFVAYSATSGQVKAYSPTRADYELAFEGLVEQGWQEIVSLHVSSALRDAYAQAVIAARDVSGARISVVDTKCVSGQLALVLAALVRDRAAGMTADDAIADISKVAAAARMYALLGAHAHPSHQGEVHVHGGIFGHADSLRARMLGIRRIFTMTPQGLIEEHFHSSELSRLAAACAREMSTYAASEGALTYVEVVAGSPGIQAIFERPLDTNEFESTRAAVLTSNPSTTAQLGVGSLILAYVPSKLVAPETMAALVRETEN